MTDVALAGGARTPICRPGGALRDVPAGALALAAARVALTEAGLTVGGIGAVVASCALPGDEGELDFAATLAGELGCGDALTLTAAGLAGSGLGALAAGVALAARDGRAVLVAGGDSASRTPYWSLVRRHGAGEGEAALLDPLGAAIAAAYPGRPAAPGAIAAPGEAAARGDVAPGARAAQDAFAARSHELARLPPAERVVKVSGAANDEPPAGDRSAAGLAALKPLHDREGTATAGNTALPADGAAAVVLVPGGAGPVFGAADATTFEVLETSAAAVLALGLAEPNPAGGAIGQGLPLGCGGLVMALRLAARLAPGETGALIAGRVRLSLAAARSA